MYPSVGFDRRNALSPSLPARWLLFFVPYPPENITPQIQFPHRESNQEYSQ